mgnify:CR=1 FL=1
MKKIGNSILLALAAVSLLAASTQNKPEASLAERVRHELVMLPYYNLFDTFSFRIDGSKVTLYGAVTRPTLKSDAENVVRRLSGVTAVDNQIEVLPLSPMDNRIRLAEYRAIYSWPTLWRLATMPNPPVHIIVRNGTVTLEGVVPTKQDSDAVFLRANGVPGVFAVENHLTVEKT